MPPSRAVPKEITDHEAAADALASALSGLPALVRRAGLAPATPTLEHQPPAALTEDLNAFTAAVIQLFRAYFNYEQCIMSVTGAVNGMREADAERLLLSAIRHIQRSQLVPNAVACINALLDTPTGAMHPDWSALDPLVVDLVLRLLKMIMIVFRACGGACACAVFQTLLLPPGVELFRVLQRLALLETPQSYVQQRAAKAERGPPPLPCCRFESPLAAGVLEVLAEVAANLKVICEGPAPSRVLLALAQQLQRHNVLAALALHAVSAARQAGYPAHHASLLSRALVNVLFRLCEGGYTHAPPDMPPGFKAALGDAVFHQACMRFVDVMARSCTAAYQQPAAEGAGPACPSGGLFDFSAHRQFLGLTVYKLLNLILRLTNYDSQPLARGAQAVKSWMAGATASGDRPDMGALAAALPHLYFPTSSRPHVDQLPKLMALSAELCMFRFDDYFSTGTLAGTLTKPLANAISQACCVRLAGLLGFLCRQVVMAHLGAAAAAGGEAAAKRLAKQVAAIVPALSAYVKDNRLDQPGAEPQPEALINGAVVRPTEGRDYAICDVVARGLLRFLFDRSYDELAPCPHVAAFSQYGLAPAQLLEVGLDVGLEPSQHSLVSGALRTMLHMFQLDKVLFQAALHLSNEQTAALCDWEDDGEEDGEEQEVAALYGEEEEAAAWSEENEGTVTLTVPGSHLLHSQPEELLLCLEAIIRLPGPEARPGHAPAPAVLALEETEALDFALEMMKHFMVAGPKAASPWLGSDVAAGCLSQIKSLIRTVAKVAEVLVARHGGPIQALDTSTAFQSMFVLCHVMDGRIASRPLRRSPLRIVASGSESTMRLLDFSDWCKKVLWAPLRMTELYAAQIASRGKTVPPSVRARRAVMEAAAAAAGGDRQHVRDALLKAAEGCEQTQKLLNACPDSTFEFEMFGCWYAHCTNLTGCSEALLKMKKCSGCQAAAYCCVECQRADWARHKQHCSSRSARNQAAAGVAADAAALGTAAAPTDGIAAISL